LVQVSRKDRRVLLCFGKSDRQRRKGKRYKKKELKKKLKKKSEKDKKKKEKKKGRVNHVGQSLYSCLCFSPWSRDLIKRSLKVLIGLHTVTRQKFLLPFISVPVC
jgi:hypothetical protein